LRLPVTLRRDCNVWKAPDAADCFRILKRSFPSGTHGHAPKDYAATAPDKPAQPEYVG
jgi:hypothetical protein